MQSLCAIVLQMLNMILLTADELECLRELLKQSQYAHLMLLTPLPSLVCLKPRIPSGHHHQ